MELAEQGYLLRVYINENSKHEGMRLYQWILRKAREQGLAGGTVLRGMAGFSARRQIQTTKILRLTENLPVVVELVDKEDRIKEFMPVIEDAVKDGLVTL